MKNLLKYGCLFAVTLSLVIQNYLLSVENNKQEKVIQERENDINALEYELDQLKGEMEFLHEEIERRNNELKQVKLELKNTKQELNNLKGKKNIPVSRGENKRELFVEMTSYTAFCPEGCTGKTKTGYDVSNTIYYEQYRVVAVDPEVIPLYSILKIETEKESFYAIALDTGGAIKGNIIDLLVENEKVAKKNGRQKAKVTVLREGKG